MRYARAVSLLVGMVLALVASCATPPAAPERAARRSRAFSSNHATLVELAFDAEVIAPVTYQPEKYVRAQLFYTVGQLNAHASVGRLDGAAIAVVHTASIGGGKLRIRYHASLPVGWGEPADIPDALDLVLPHDVTALSAFVAAYRATCVEEAGHTVDTGNFWFHFRPNAPGCAFDPAAIVTAHAILTPASGDPSVRYPEYDEIWDDGELRVVAVFAKYTPYSVDASDPGIIAYEAFLADAQEALGPDATTTPSPLADAPGVPPLDVTLAADGPRRIVINALLIDAPDLPNAAFDARYAELSRDADVLLYSGHAGLGANVRALAEKGSFRPGKYQLFFFDGCDTFAYLDDRLAERRAKLNPDDPSGSKYMDVLTTLTPAYFGGMPGTAVALIEALSDPAYPNTYRGLLDAFDPSAVVVVTGEADNTYEPAAAAPYASVWSATVPEGDVARFATPFLSAGTYRVAMTEPPDAAGGDADLYVGIGREPTLDVYDARPYLAGTDESAIVTLDRAARIDVMIAGYAAEPGRASVPFVVSVDPIP